MKLMFVGPAERGKTTLLQCIRNGGVTPPRKSQRHPPVLSTLGVQVSQWKYAHRPGVEYKLSCWDFAGQEDFYATHQCFLTPRSVYLLVYDLSRGDKELPSIVSWLLNIYARAPQSPVIVVGTHRDLIPKGERGGGRFECLIAVLCWSPHMYVGVSVFIPICRRFLSASE